MKGKFTDFLFYFFWITTKETHNLSETSITYHLIICPTMVCTWVEGITMGLAKELWSKINSTQPGWKRLGPPLVVKGNTKTNKVKICMYIFGNKTIQGQIIKMLCAWSPFYIMSLGKPKYTLISMISSVESQKGIITIQWCSVENQKGAITFQSL